VVDGGPTVCMYSAPNHCRFHTADTTARHQSLGVVVVVVSASRRAIHTPGLRMLWVCVSSAPNGRRVYLTGFPRPSRARNRARTTRMAYTATPLAYAHTHAHTQHPSSGNLSVETRRAAPRRQ
jgi:hypothetical protein